MKHTHNCNGTTEMHSYCKLCVDDVKRWLWTRNYHYHGDFRVTLGHGGQLDLSEVLTDFADLYFGAANARIKAWQKIAEDAVNVKPTAPMLLSDPSERAALLEALKQAKVRLQICLSRFWGCDDKHEVSIEELPDWIVEAEAAIRKAEGR